MQTRALRSLVQISKTRSFAKAADQLNMTLPALSMQMKALETELGVDVFDRSVRPPRLTPIGRSIVDEAVPLLRQEEAIQAFCRPSEVLVGHFRLGFVTTAAVRLLPSFIKNARVSAPLATFDFETGLSKSLQERVAHGQIDAAVVTDADGLPDVLSSVVLREEPFVFAAHQKLMEEGLEALLARHTFFHFMPDTGIGKLIAGEMQTWRRSRKVQTVVLDNLEAIMECVTNGLGFTLLPEPDVERYRSAEVGVVGTPDRLKRTLILATLRDGVLSQHEAALSEILMGRLRAPEVR